MDGIEEIRISDASYPEILKQIPRPPKSIFVRGGVLRNESCFAVVGARNCSAYGKQTTLDLCGPLIDEGLTIVSGLAPGIDTFAHKAAVGRNKRTIAVLGTGLDEKSIYPKENIFLSRKIIECGGCLMSEYPPGTRGSQFTFPQRNRIISGLSLGTLVVEAKEKSGALITANYAFLQKRKVFAVPGPIHSATSRGPHFLIKKGAKLVDNATDILQELGLKWQSLPLFGNVMGSNPEENLVIKALKEQPLCIDKIIEITKLEAPKVAGIITVLEMNGKIRNLGSNTFSLISKT